MMTDSFKPKTRLALAFAVLVFAFGLAPATAYHMNLWNLDEDGLQAVTKRLPYWDFSNLWAGTRLALDGHVGTLFDVEAYRAALRAMFSPDLPPQEWSYPPSIILLGAPLALMPVLPAYLVWTFGTIFLLHLAIRPLRLPSVAARRGARLAGRVHQRDVRSERSAYRCPAHRRHCSPRRSARSSLACFSACSR